MGEGNVFSLFTSGGGGVPISHNALQHYPECHGAAGGGTLVGGGTLAGGCTLAGGVPWWEGYPGRGVPGQGTPPPGQVRMGGVPS